MGTEIQPFNSTSMAASSAAVGGVWGVSPAKRCDGCKTAAAATFCGADSAYLCLQCDGRIHREKQSTRVWMCEVCEQAPAAVTCKADAAALCVTCDLDIHSANPVAHRHERVPIEPFFESPADHRAYANPKNENRAYSVSVGGGGGEVDGISWTFPGSGFPQLNQKREEMQRKDQLFGEMDELLEFEYGDLLEGRFQPSYSYGGSDGVVPVQSKQVSVQPTPAVVGHHQFVMGGCENGIGLEFDFSRSKLSSFSYPAQSSLSNSVSSSSHDAGVVPDGICSNNNNNNNNNSISEISFSFEHNNSISCPQAPAASAKQRGMDREARVMRYREKRKNRKFEKTIRYASRKAYAETRPRIKGRFAKRCSPSSSENNNSGLEPAAHDDHRLEEMMFYGSSLPFFADVDGRYGVVPSFR
ncbi:Zinc finger protein CONSTANS-LIKE 5 [Linum perenne]